MTDSEQLRHWRGDFGNAYTERNIVPSRIRLAAFKDMLAEIRLASVLEVGCNRGHNLGLLSELHRNIQLVGLEPNATAARIARESFPEIAVLDRSGFDIPFEDGFFDLTFTSGVLIHVASHDLPRIIGEIYRVTHRYILAIEYFAEKETPVHYRDHANLLWKRDYFQRYVSQFPELTLLRSGQWGKRDGFDRCHWWLMEKPR